MTDITVSVVIVSRDRAQALMRCLLGVSQLQFPAFEVIVVADPTGIAAAEKMPFAELLKLVPFDEANISEARNLGLVHAAGDVVAFIDDDAIPEPQWLRYLTAPVVKPNVAAMTGFVRGRNGISFQWRAQGLNGLGQPGGLEVDATQATVLTPPKGRAIKTEGTNMAFRRDVLVAIGGFDPAFHYYLEETDLNMRLARAGHATAISPLAEVHHGFAPNRMRRADRVPSDLFDIGASWAVFARKYIPDADRELHWQTIRTAERRRLLSHMCAGRLEPRDISRLLGRLDGGHSNGLLRAITTTKLPNHPASPFKAFPYEPKASILIQTRLIGARAAQDRAAAHVAEGGIATVIILSLTSAFHRLSFNDQGVWVQRGGQFGRSDRGGKLVQVTHFRRRVRQERARIALQRGLIN
ncbi:glycosyl transferase family 2 [Sulfitobacter sp. SK012]|uniref:glycosyltransferase family 2 protein n=1 Tax=Sulfitobacter sp. SK012 TaxID=1389005 RepID=UPI000E0A218E|nr:glycosyltransferase family 2 protein [Sulfitobacter sp. SK012]AXI44672.1 glycosyl transferase family 2 [Sulfitobacter sp. SK012]